MPDQLKDLEKEKRVVAQEEGQVDEQRDHGVPRDQVPRGLRTHRKRQQGDQAKWLCIGEYEQGAAQDEQHAHIDPFLGGGQAVQVVQ